MLIGTSYANAYLHIHVFVQPLGFPKLVVEALISVSVFMPKFCICHMSACGLSIDFIIRF